MKILFVCTAAQQRSPTGVDVIKEFFPWNEAKYAGVHPLAEIPLTKEAIEWADLIFVMEKMHKDFMFNDFQEALIGKNIIILGIPDIYPRGDPKLVELMKGKLREFLRGQ